MNLAKGYRMEQKPIDGGKSMMNGSNDDKTEQNHSEPGKMCNNGTKHVRTKTSLEIKSFRAEQMSTECTEQSKCL